MSSYAPIVRQNLSKTNNDFPQNPGFNRHYSEKDISFCSQSKKLLSENRNRYSSSNGNLRKAEPSKQTHSSYSSLPYAYISQNDLSLFKYQANQIPLTTGMLAQHSTKIQKSPYPLTPMQKVMNEPLIGNYASEPESNYDSDIGALSSKYTSLDRRRNDERR